jgi:hypothetical protein
MNIARLPSKNRLLWITGSASLALGLLMVALIFLDSASTPILGLNRWVKPMKFDFSIVIFVWTMAWILAELPQDFSRKIARGITIAMIVEIVCITGQSARGVRSHFNQDSVFDGLVFTVMGIAILYNTVLCARVLWQTWKKGGLKKGLPEGYVWGLRLGLLSLILGSLEGGFMSSQTAGSGHAIGQPDGGPGLPLLNWSTQAGDLRVSHFLALHGLQVMLALGLISQKKKGPVFAGFGVYLILVIYTLATALLGKPFLG